MLTDFTATVSTEPTDYVRMRTTKGDMIIRLFPDVAPQTVANFKKLVGEGFYNGLIFHRVISDFMIQGGDPNGNSTGGSGSSVDGEFTENGFENNLRHVRGVISMARSIDPDSASSQFFIVHSTSEDNFKRLDGKYASFGFVAHGQEVIDAIASEATDQYDKPITDVIINSVEFVTISK
jgi:peptidyl-prolyl cis-trans isomerase B (cyclophilin B)